MFMEEMSEPGRGDSYRVKEVDTICIWKHF